MTDLSKLPMSLYPFAAIPAEMHDSINIHRLSQSAEVEGRYGYEMKASAFVAKHTDPCRALDEDYKGQHITYTASGDLWVCGHCGTLIRRPASYQR
ncbi:hypothetical protein [Phyllobacterium endophyticum]|uniref:Uncharacterized protein n=1 Tax=Phyllobacterium endophyticum TaxID=1149773 RepID=A0A2P7ALL6_9HYPH|nr:hypothetical protein [Phyllobacterium endophyticum]MBB3236347.1 rubrerythrin [Phyllobacterium endophyticum]PSH55113.1 hypothetical protein CU100_23805 [Phyllobacterium endophyticum]TYR39884.1 hypothetical protein FY050_19885 [Phyllobacterium endophyticum]